MLSNDNDFSRETKRHKQMLIFIFIILTKSMTTSCIVLRILRNGKHNLSPLGFDLSIDAIMIDWHWTNKIAMNSLIPAKLNAERCFIQYLLKDISNQSLGTVTAPHLWARQKVLLVCVTSEEGFVGFMKNLRRSFWDYFAKVISL